jgi:hypothetical protein
MLSQSSVVNFAEKYRVRVKRDDCGECIVRGKLGHLYEHGAVRFGISLEAPPNNARSDRTLRARRRRAIGADFVTHQEGDSEAVLTFDPADASHQSRELLKGP